MLEDEMRKYNKSIRLRLGVRIKNKKQIQKKKNENNSSDRKCFKRIRNTLK